MEIAFINGKKKEVIETLDTKKRGVEAVKLF